MGFGAGLFFIFILGPLGGLVFLVWLMIEKPSLKQIGRLTVVMVVLLTFLTVLSAILKFVTSKKVLDKGDYYGSYVIDRSFFSGKQADWQYNSFRFEIKENDSIYFHLTDKERLIKTYKGKIATRSPHGSARLIILAEDPTHSILKSLPTTYRSAWSFYLVLHSPDYHNMYFKKAKWKPID